MRRPGACALPRAAYLESRARALIKASSLNENSTATSVCFPVITAGGCVGLYPGKRGGAEINSSTPLNEQCRRSGVSSSLASSGANDPLSNSLFGGRPNVHATRAAADADRLSRFVSCRAHFTDESSQRRANPRRDKVGSELTP